MAGKDRPCTIEVGVDLFGYDIKGGVNLQVESAEGCAELCDTSVECKFFTYIWGKLCAHLHMHTRICVLYGVMCYVDGFTRVKHFWGYA